jgi:hypothetical protein
MPGMSKTAQAIVATRCLEDSLHVPMMTIPSCLCKTLTLASSRGLRHPMGRLIWLPVCHPRFSDGRFLDSDRITGKPERDYLGSRLLAKHRTPSRKNQRRACVLVLQPGGYCHEVD